MKKNSEYVEYPLEYREFDLFRKLIFKNSGINLPDKKLQLVKSRLTKRLRSLGIKCFRDYYKFVIREGSNGQELINMLDAISTNKTDFFREINHFDFLKSHALPKLFERKKQAGVRRIRIWSCGCSSGEEPYTLAISLSNYLGVDISNWDVKILAADLSSNMLRTAMTGIYDKEKLEGVSLTDLQNHFKKLGGNMLGSYEVKKHLKDLITFRRMDMINDKFPFKGKFDIIFCRNVMIYFTKETQLKLITKFFNVTDDNGFLFIGHSESLTRLNIGYQFIQPTIYQKK